jgi:hypothetical protein
MPLDDALKRRLWPQDKAPIVNDRGDREFVR